jgi:hypothetical protein
MSTPARFKPTMPLELANLIAGISGTYTASYFTTGRFECFLHICTFVGTQVRYSVTYTVKKATVHKGEVRENLLGLPD